MGKEIKAEIKDSTGAVGSFFNSFGKGAGLCIGVCVAIFVLIFLFFILIGIGSGVSQVASSDEFSNQQVTNSAVVSESKPVQVISEPKPVIQNNFSANSLLSELNIGGVGVKILNAYSVKADKQTKFYFEVSSENKSSSDVYTPSASSFQIEDAEKYVTDSEFALGLDQAYPFFQKLSPNQKVKGFVFFEVNNQYIPKNLILKEWNLFGNDKYMSWTIQNGEIKTIPCIVDYDCENSIKYSCVDMKCVFNEGYCAVDSDCIKGEECNYGYCQEPFSWN